jgi:hypothetical protein
VIGAVVLFALNVLQSVIIAYIASKSSALNVVALASHVATAGRQSAMNAAKSMRSLRLTFVLAALKCTALIAVNRFTVLAAVRFIPRMHT